MVFSGLSTACLFASCPTRRSPVLVNATTEGVNRLPSEFVITVGFPPSITETTEFVVPKSIPTAFAMAYASLNSWTEGVTEGRSDLFRAIVAVRPTRGGESTCFSQIVLSLSPLYDQNRMPRPVQQLLRGPAHRNCDDGWIKF